MALSHCNTDNAKITEFRKNSSLRVGDHVIFAKVWYPKQPDTAWAMRLIDHTVDEPLKWKVKSQEINGDMLLLSSSIPSNQLRTITEMMCHAAGLQGNLKVWQEGGSSCWYEVLN